MMSKLISFFNRHSISTFFLLVFVALIYGTTAFSNNFYVDAEVILNNPGTIYNWDEIGRFGLISLKYLIGGNWYNPYFEGVLFLLTYWVLSLLCVYFIASLMQKEDTVPGVLFALLALIYPTYADQFMFRFQSFEIAFAMVLIILAGIHFEEYLKNKKKSLAVTIILLEFFSFGIYQSMVNLMLSVFIIIYLFTVKHKDKKERVFLIKSACILFLIGFVLYELVVKLFFSSGDYLGSQIGWLSKDLGQTVLNMLAYAKRVLLSLDVFYPITFSLVVILAIAMMIYFAVTKNKKTGVYIFALFATLASPFLLCILTGTPTVYRAQCMLPFANAAIIVFVINEVCEKLDKKIFRYICVGIALSLILVQSSVVLRLFYTQDTIRKGDEITAISIIEELNENDVTDDLPVIFVGSLEPKINGSCYNKLQAQSFLAYSLFGFAYVDGVPIDDADYYNTYRILGYFKSLGFNYMHPTKELVSQAIESNSSIPVWPLEGSVIKTEEYILVNLGVK